LARGRGDELKPLTGLGKFWHLVVFPNKQVSTKSIYQGLNSGLMVRHSSGSTSSPFALSERSESKGSPSTLSGVEGLTNTNNNVKMLICALKKRDFRQVSGYIYNSLEAVTQEQYPVVAKIKHHLQAQGLDIVGMSGSGSAVFAIVRTKKEAERFESIISQGTDWRTFVVSTL
jgi:4-diphosphocytidyl-2C-methyl-D-erythritol kinase